MTIMTDREFGTCVKCKQRLLLNEDKLCIHCELDSLQEKLGWKDLEISKYRRKNNELYAQLNNILSEQASRTGKGTA